MRRIALFAAVLLVSACARREVPQAQPQAPAAPSKHDVRADLVGATAGELIQVFGQPALQVREGPGLKLQFRGRSCVLDAYLYGPPQGSGPERVTHVDTRVTSGAATDQAACIASLARL
jgi:hypothetical protein